MRSTLRRVGWGLPLGIAPPISIRPIKDHPLFLGFVGSWIFGSQALAGDISGNDNDMTLVGSPALLSSLQGPSVSLNGSTQYLSLPSKAAFTGDFTMSFWINLSSLSGNQQLIADW